METLDRMTFVPRRSRVAAWLQLAYLDRVMLAAALGLIAFSLLTLATATRHDVPGEPLHFALRQGAYALLGIALMIAVSRLDYQRLREVRMTIYTAMIGSIAVVLLLGAAIRGSHRWIELPYLRFQPSELAKILLVVSLAAFAYERARRPVGFRHTLRLLGLGLAPAGLVFLQPDLGTGIVLGAATLAVLFLAAVPWQHFAAIAAAGAVLGAGALLAAPAVGVEVLQGYQEERLTSFLHPSDDPADSSYQVNQSVIAVGSGEETGRGDEATQSELLFLPERHTDFIFAVIGERFGFLGAGLVIALYAMLLWRALRTMSLARSFYGTLIAGGIAAMLAFQLLVNAGMNLGIMPVAGIPLPLVSYGGSSVLASLLAVGLLQSIHVQAARARTLSVPSMRSATFGPLTAVPGTTQHPPRQGRRRRASAKT
jgi:rod shape determining protein RodA